MAFEDDENLAAQAMEARAYEEAVRLLRPLAERNSEYALLSLGWIYETGATGAADRDAARSLYETAALQGSASANFYLGSLLLRAGDETKAREAFECGVQLNDDDCRTALARLANNADEKLAAKALKEEDFDRAIRLLRPLAERDSEYALLCLGSIFEMGVTGTTDNEAAGSYYARAASQGSAEGYFGLGRVLSEQGDEVQARSAFNAGAQRGHITCMSRVGRMMLQGRGGPIDINGGTAWLRKAAAKGHLFAQRTLLALDDREAKSLRDKLVVRLRVLALMLKAAREKFKNPDSDSFR